MVIYLICSELNNEKVYKIGFTKRDINKRIKEFKTGNAGDIEIISTFESKWASKIESHWHISKQNNNINGEWFRLSDDDVKNFIPICQNIHNNFELLNKHNTWVIDNKIL